MAKAKPEPIPVDEIAEYNAQFIEHTEHPLSDTVYKWIIGRYTRNKHEFTGSDKFVWHGACYLLPVYFGYMLFFGLFYFLGNVVYNKYGWPKLFMLFMLLILWRLNTAIGLMRSILKKTK